MGVVEMRAASAKLRKLPGRCKMCGSKKHSTEWHLKKVIGARGPRTVEHRRKLGLAQKGKPSWNKGLKGSVPGFSSNPKIEAERRRKISEGQKLADHWWCRGKNNHKWKGTDYSKEDAEFRRLRVIVRARDKETCQHCGRTSKQIRIVVHHIDHDHSHNWLDNLIALCHPDNVRAENKKNKAAWEKKFREYTKSIVYQIA
jgi:5-methylcytosine-specific restriction endonuclease McrA